MSLLNEVYCLLTHTFLVIVLYCLCQGELVLHGLLYIVTLIQAQLCVQILSCLFSSLPSFGAHGMCHCFHNFHPLFTHCVFPNCWCFPHSLFSIPSVCLSFSIFFFHLSTSISLWFTNQTGSTGYSPWTNYKPSLLRNCSCLCVVSSLPVGHTVTCLTTLNPSLDTQKKGKSTT